VSCTHSDGVRIKGIDWCPNCGALLAVGDKWRLPELQKMRCPFCAVADFCKHGDDAAQAAVQGASWMMAYLRDFPREEVVGAVCEKHQWEASRNDLGPPKEKTP